MSMISENDYRRVKLLYKKFGCKSVIGYLLYYCIIDVLLMSQFFEHFRRYFMDWCSLDPARFFTKHDKLITIVMFFTINIVTFFRQLIFIQKVKMSRLIYLFCKILYLSYVGLPGKFSKL